MIVDKEFYLQIRVVESDIDLMGHVNNIVYLRYVQDAATAHWMAIAPEDLIERLAWVIRRHEIDYLRPAFINEELIVKTWLGSTTAATWERFTEIYRESDQQLLVKVKSVWVALDASTNRPRRIDEEMLGSFRM